MVKKVNLIESPDLVCCRLTCEGFGVMVVRCQREEGFSMHDRSCQRLFPISFLEGEEGFAPEGFAVSLGVCYSMLEMQVSFKNQTYFN